MVKAAGSGTRVIDRLDRTLDYTAEAVAESKRRVRESSLSLLRSESRLAEGIAMLKASLAILEAAVVRTIGQERQTGS